MGHAAPVHSSDSEFAPEEDRKRKEAKNLQLSKKFLLEDRDRVEELYILKVALTPQTTLMRALLKKNSTEHDLNSSERVYDMSTPITRSRMLDLHVSGSSPDGLFWACMVSMAENLTRPHKWLHLSQTEAVSTSIVTLCLRPLAILHDWLVRPLQSWPYKWLRCTAEPEAIQDLLEEARTQTCVLDDFSKELLQRIDDGDMLAADVPLTVAAAMMHMFGNTFAVEQMHSCNSRRARRRVQAKAMTVADLAMWLQSSNTFAWLDTHKASTSASSSFRLRITLSDALQGQSVLAMVL